MKKILLILIILAVGFVESYAQCETETDIPGPKKGNVDVTLLFGNSSNYGSWLALPSADESSYTVYSPMVSDYPTSNSLCNMIGVEGKWFFTDSWAVRLNGGAVLSSSPAYDGVEGLEGETSLTTIPTYNDVPARENSEYIFNAGVDKYFSTNNEHLYWYVAPVLNFHYARKVGYEVYGSDATDDPGTTRYGEGWGFGLSAVAGAEYYTSTGIVFGFELTGASYMYSQNSILPMEGLEPLRADNHNFQFLATPTLKVGFKF